MNNEKLETKNTPKKRIISSIVLFVLSLIAFVFYIIFFVEIIEGISLSKTEPGLDTGLQIAFGIIFSAIFGIIQLVLSAFSLLFVFLARKASLGKTRKTLTGFLILNFIFSLFTAVSFAVICIVA